MAIQRLSHIGICVSDLTRSEAFYTSGLGFARVSDLEVEGAPVDTLLEIEGTRLHAVYLERDGTRIELLGYDHPGTTGTADPRPMNALGLTHLSIRVSDLDAAISRLTELGGRVLTHTRTGNPQFDVDAIFVTDPDGTRIELLQQPGDPNALPGQ